MAQSIFQYVKGGGRGLTQSKIVKLLEDCFILLKPRVMYLSIFTAGVAIITVSVQRELFDIWLILQSITAIAIGAGGAGALNMWYDSDIDILMHRTATRPIPAGRLPRWFALVIGLLLCIISVCYLDVVSNTTAAFLLAFTQFFYVAIYTVWLKRWTPQNIVIGGAAGALPPVVGWAAVTGSVSFESVSLFLIIFFWTPPHFWALSLLCTKDYERAKIPMLTVVKGTQHTKKMILYYSLVLFLVSSIPWLIGSTGVFYLSIAIILGLVFLILALRLYLNSQEKHARRLFLYSINYLFILFGAFMVDSLIG